MGETVDDAVGESFDKVAKLLGLSYPGGPEIEKFAQNGNINTYDLPHPLKNQKNMNFSFSGIKTAVSLIAKNQKKITPDQDGFRSFFEEIANHLNGKKFNIIEAWEGLKSIELAAAIYYSSMSETKVFLPLDRSNLVYKDWRPK